MLKLQGKVLRLVRMKRVGQQKHIAEAEEGGDAAAAAATTAADHDPEQEQLLHQVAELQRQNQASTAEVKQLKQQI